jgi:hypothetical protein
MNNNYEVNVVLAKKILKESLLKALEEIGDEAKGSSWFAQNNVVLNTLK